MKVEFYPEICCEECNDTIHNHFDCPACNKTYAGTSVYDEIDSYYETVDCQECGARFKFLKNLGYNEWEIEQIPVEIKSE